MLLTQVTVIRIAISKVKSNRLRRILKKALKKYHLTKLTKKKNYAYDDQDDFSANDFGKGEFDEDEEIEEEEEINKEDDEFEADFNYDIDSVEDIDEDEEDLEDTDED